MALEATEAHTEALALVVALAVDLAEAPSMVAEGTLEVEGPAGTGNGRGKCFTLRANTFRDLAPQFAFANCAFGRRECLTSNGPGATAAHRLAKPNCAFG